MSIPIPAQAEIVVEIDSRCFCCFRLPGSSTKSSNIQKKVTEQEKSVTEKVTEVFKNTPKNNEDDALPRLSRQRAVSFFDS